MADQGAPPNEPHTEPETERHWNRAQWRLARAVLGTASVAPAFDDAPYDAALIDSMVTTGRRARQQAVLADQLSLGVPFETAVLNTVRALAGENERVSARALLLGLEPVVGRALSAIGQGLVLVSTNDHAHAWEYFAEAGVHDLARLVPVEAVTAARAAASPESVAVAVELAGRTTSYDVETLAELAGRFLVTDHRDLAVTLLHEARTRELPQPGSRAAVLLDNLAPWVDDRPEPAVTGIGLAVIDYPQPDYDRSSRNLGDYVQTLAMLGNLARFGAVRFHGEDGLGELMAELQGRVKPRLRLSGAAADVTLLPVSRDYSAGDPVPENTWLVAFGWHLHPTYHLGYGLPYHPNLNPVFVSFHLNRVGALTPEVVDYLRANGPIGCRDWTTVDLLNSAGVDAFFTGCLTTTVDAVFPDFADVDRSGADVVGAVDLTARQVHRIPGRVEELTHHGLDYRQVGVAHGVRAASAMLDTYLQRFKRIVTSRLHSYLPATSLGIDVRFRPVAESDVRFDGLLGMEPEAPAFTAIRDGIRELLADTFGRIFAGADRDEVRAHWRKLTMPYVEEARARLAEPPRLPAPSFDLTDALARVVADTHRIGPHDRLPADPSAVSDVAMSLDQNLAGLMPVTVESMLANATGPVRLWITTRGLGESYRRWFGEQFPDLPVVFLGMDHVDYGEVARLIGHTTIATMDRLLLPEMLPELDRITYVDIDTVVEGDVCELAATDLRGHPLAARTTFQSGAHQWRTAGDLLAPEDAFELRRLMSAQHPFDFTTFNAGVLVLDLARLRADRFTPDLVPRLAGRFGLNDQDVFNAYAGADRVELAPRWNALPTFEHVREPGIVHYAGAGKPWGAAVVPEGERWLRYARRFAERAAPLPEDLGG